MTTTKMMMTRRPHNKRARRAIQNLVAYVQRVYQTYTDEKGNWVATDVTCYAVPSKRQHVVAFSMMMSNPIAKITTTETSDIHIELFYAPSYSLELDRMVLKREKRTVQAIIEEPNIIITLFFDKGHYTEYPNTSDLVDTLVRCNLLLDNYGDE